MKLLHIVSILAGFSMSGFSQTVEKSETIALNGVNIYYEVYGKGEPLFLLHGFTQSSKSWQEYVDDYSTDFAVYLVDLRGHGRSSQFKETISVPDVAKDLEALAAYLKLESINAIGFSYGGEVLFQLALLHPGLVKSMVIIGSCGTWHAKEFPEFVDYLSYKNIDNLPWMREQQTSEEQIKSILEQVPNYNVSVSDAELRSIQTRTLLVHGDQDPATPVECVANAKKHLPNSFLWVLPNTPHRAHSGEHQTEFVKVSKEFFGNSWSGSH
ncbi:MAG TPA: alpha/beta hydrolase [Cyclobacteriaceae bacterium]|nr:alpha/beta hydrolase [Cyclobacteriaceae bacterium]